MRVSPLTETVVELRVHVLPTVGAQHGRRFSAIWASPTSSEKVADENHVLGSRGVCSPRLPCRGLSDRTGTVIGLLGLRGKRSPLPDPRADGLELTDRQSPTFIAGN